METVSVSRFVEILGKSGLLDAAKMQQIERAAAQATHSQQLAQFLIHKRLLSRWQAQQLLAGHASFMLGKYRLIDLLGKGATGSVFLAEHTAMNRRVALKIVPKGIERNPAAMKQFTAEARAIALLDHPNIVRAYSVDHEADRYFMVMEYVEGPNLEYIVGENGPLGYSRAVNYIRQTAEGLAHAHARGMVHCDIKPSNLLVNTQGTVKILDLGLARLTNDQEAASSREYALGTVDYMAPEQGLNDHSFDHRADIYSLGCTLFFLLIGEPPFSEGSLAQRIVQHQTQPPPNILEKRPDAPRQLVRICCRMMAKNPQDRYPSAQEAAFALGELNCEQSLKQALPLDFMESEPIEVTDQEPKVPATNSKSPFNFWHVICQNIRLRKNR